MNDTATVARWPRKSTPRVEVTSIQYEAMRARIFNGLNIVGAVRQIERIADDVNAGLQHATPCYTDDCKDKRCEVDCVGY